MESTPEAGGEIIDDEKIFERVAAGDLTVVVDLYLKNEALLTARDAQGNTLLHIAAESGQRTLARGLMALTINDCLWEQKNNNDKTPFDVATPKVRKDLQLITMKNSSVVDHHTVYNKQLVDERLAKPNENYKVLLSIDGGGIKAILEMSMLIAIERELKEPLMSRVHWLAGTSCGGIISLTLGVGVTCEQSRRVFLSARDRTFCGNTKMFPKHNAKGLEDVLRTSLGKSTTMQDISTHKILITAAKVKHAPPSLVLFRTFAPRIHVREYEKHGYLNPEKVLVWKAARSTSAAPVYFQSFHGLADGAIFCNNPCITLISDFLRLKKLENYKGIVNKDEIGCIISVGSGLEPVLPLGGIDINLNSKMALGHYKDVWGKGKNLVTLFMYQCTSSHAVPVGQAREWAHSLGVPFFRFNPKLSRAFELDSCALDGVFDFLFETEVYLHTQVRQEIQEVVRLLRSMPKNEIQDYKSTIH